MLKKPFFMLAAPTLFFANVVWAGCSGHSCSDVTVDRLVVRSNGDISVDTSGDEINLTCDADGGSYIRLKKDVNNFDHVYSLLLTSHTTEHPLWVRTTDAGECEVAYVVSDK